MYDARVTVVMCYSCRTRERIMLLSRDARLKAARAACVTIILLNPTGSNRTRSRTRVRVFARRKNPNRPPRCTCYSTTRIARRRRRYNCTRRVLLIDSCRRADGNIELSPTNTFGLSELSTTNIFRLFESFQPISVIQETPRGG